MQTQALQTSDSNRQIAAIRAAQNAAAREKLRSQNAASRISTPGTLRSQRTSFLYPGRQDPLYSGSSSLFRRLSMLSVQSSASASQQALRTELEDLAEDEQGGET